MPSATDATKYNRNPGGRSTAGYAEHVAQVAKVYSGPKRQAAAMKVSSTPLRELLRKLGPELIIAELATWAAYHGDPLPGEDRNRTLLAIRRMDAIRKTIDARLR